MNVKLPWNKCRRYEEDLSLLAAEVLSAQERVGVEAHCHKCPACQARFAELKLLATHLARHGVNLPQVEPSVSLRRRWMAEVRESARVEKPPESFALPFGISSGRLAWSSLVAIWGLILFFQFSAPQTSRPPVTASSPPSLREVLLALKVEPREPPFQANVRGF